jgi:hypothetical protein
MALVAGIAMLLLASTAGGAFAVPGSTGSISGYVKEAVTGTPIAGAVVEVWEGAGVDAAATGFTVTAGFSGDYSVTGLPAGNYELHAADPTGLHYPAATGALTVGTGGTLAPHIFMDPAGYLSGSVRGGSGEELADSRVYLFSVGCFPLPPSPDPGPRRSGADGSYSFSDVVDPLSLTDQSLAGDYVVAAREGSTRVRRASPARRPSP